MSLKTLQFDISTTDGNCDCYAAYPDDGEKHASVLLLMDGYGPRPYLYDMAKELASHGYYVLLPNLFYRQKRAPVIDMKFPLSKEKLPAAREQLMSLFHKHDAEASVRDVGSFLNFLSEQTGVNPGKVGVTGYCMGGGIALRSAEEYSDRIVAVASFHGGRLATDSEKSPHRFVNKIKARLYVAHADHDQSMPQDQIDRLTEALDQAGVQYESEIYKGASHGFTMLDLPVGNKEALERHWKKLLPLFEMTLKS